MLNILPYKKFIAALLLLLYTFIATPTQYWHSHKNSTSTKTASVKYQRAAFEKSMEQTMELDCAICSHHYSIYNEVSPISFQIFIPLHRTNYIIYKASIPETRSLFFSNKGPPTFV